MPSASESPDLPLEPEEPDHRELGDVESDRGIILWPGMARYKSPGSSSYPPPAKCVWARQYAEHHRPR